MLIAAWFSLLPAVYFVLSSDVDVSRKVMGGAAVLGMVLVNWGLGRVSPERVVTPRVGTVFAILEIVLLTLAWDSGGQASIQLLTCTVALLALAVVGVRLGELVAVALALLGVYLVIV